MITKDEVRKKIASLVEEQLQNRIDYCEQRINEIVYELYGLTKEEIALIENA